MQTLFAEKCPVSKFFSTRIKLTCSTFTYWFIVISQTLVYCWFEFANLTWIFYILMYQPNMSHKISLKCQFKDTQSTIINLLIMNWFGVTQLVLLSMVRIDSKIIIWKSLDCDNSSMAENFLSSGLILDNNLIFIGFSVESWLPRGIAVRLTLMLMWTNQV